MTSASTSCSDCVRPKSTSIGIQEPESLPRMVNEPDVSLDEMLSLACRQGKLDIVKLLMQSGAKVNHRNKAGNTPLLEACSQGHVNVGKYLLENDAEIDSPTETTLDSALTWACTLGNTTVVELLLHKHANVEHRTKDGCTALMFACLAGHMQVARKLLDHSAKINVESDSNKDSPLTFACWKGHSNVVELLLKRGADIEHRTKEGFSPLMFAALGGHNDVATKLLERNAQVNVPSGSNNDIPLTSACWKGHHDVVKLLLEHKSNIEHRTKDGCTPLMLAAREGHIDVARLLLKNGAAVNVPSGSENNIPLTLACWKGHTRVVELLLENNSDIEHRNKAGCTPLMLASREGHLDTTKLLLESGAQVNVPSGSNDDTPLTLACWKGHYRVVELLLRNKSNVDHQTKTGCTPLMEATREGHKKVADILLNHGADVELPDNYGQSPLFMACWKGHHCVAELLLERGANRDCRTKTGITPLFQACRENHVDIVELLLEYGGSVNSPFPNSRENPLTLAAEKGHKELTDLLLLRGANHDCHTKKGCTPLFLSTKEGHKEIAEKLYKNGADLEATDCRGYTPVMAAFKNGHVQVVEWLLKHVYHLPSDELCHKILMASADEKDKEIIVQKRSKCLALIQEAKKWREQQALRNAQILVQELDDERTREEKKKKKQAAKRRDKRRKKKSLRESESGNNGNLENEPLENRVDENAIESVSEDQLEGSPGRMDEVEDNIDELEDDEIHESGIPHENREEVNEDEVFEEEEDQHVCKSQGKTTAGNTTVGDMSDSPRGSIADRLKSVDMSDQQDHEENHMRITKERNFSHGKQLRLSSSLPETENWDDPVQEESKTTEISVKMRRRSTSSSPNEEGLSHGSEKWARPKSATAYLGSRDVPQKGSKADSQGHVKRYSYPEGNANREYSEDDWKEIHRTSKTLIIQMTVPNSYCGRVIGRGGSKINSITDESGAQITINKPESQTSNDRLMLIKGSPSNVERARYLVTEALNSPSIFQTTGRNNLTLAGFINQKSLASTGQPREKSSFPTSSKASTSEIPRSVGASTSAERTTAASVTSAMPTFTSPPHRNMTHTDNNRMTYSKITSGMFQVKQEPKHILPAPVRIATTSAVCTQSEITTLSRAVHPAAMDMPRDSDGIVMNTAAGVNEEPRPLTSAIGVITTDTGKGSLSSVSSSFPSSHTQISPESQKLSDSGKKETEFSYFSPWHKTRVSDTKPIPVETSRNPLEAVTNADQGPLQSFSSLVEASLYSRDIPPYPWHTTDIPRQDRSRSWAGRSSLSVSDTSPLQSNESNPLPRGNRSVSSEALNERSPQGLSSAWDTVIDAGRKSHSENEADERVFIDKMPWMPNGSEPVSDSALMSNPETWEPSSSPTSSVSSSRQELNNILDNDSGVGGSNLWTQTPTSEQGRLSQPPQDPFLESALEASPWLHTRGAYSAPSSPALPRNENSPFLSPSGQQLRSHPSMEELNSRPWGKGRGNQRDRNATWSNRRSTPPGRRYSSGALHMNMGTDTHQDSGMSSPHHQNRNNDGLGSTPGYLLDATPDPTLLHGGGLWQQDKFDTVGSVAELLSSLSLEKYRDTLEERGIDLDTLVNLTEAELQTFGIAKGPRLKIMKASEIIKTKTSTLESTGLESDSRPMAVEQMQFRNPLTGFTSNSAFVPPPPQSGFPPGFDFQPQRFGFVQQQTANRPGFGGHGLMNGLTASNRVQARGVDYAFPTGVSPVLPGNMTQGPLRFIYQDNPAFFFYQQQ